MLCNWQWIQSWVTNLMALYIFCRLRALPACCPTPSDLRLKTTDLQLKVSFDPASLTSSDIGSILFFTILLLWMEPFSSFRFWQYLWGRGHHSLLDHQTNGLRQNRRRWWCLFLLLLLLL
ncbi:hypothetical protein V8E52_000967 [Russula decolorans]